MGNSHVVVLSRSGSTLQVFQGSTSYYAEQYTPFTANLGDALVTTHQVARWIADEYNRVGMLGASVGTRGCLHWSVVPVEG
jgi:hypothetical protein